MSFVTQSSFDINEPKGPIGQLSRPLQPVLIKRFKAKEDVLVGSPVMLDTDGTIKQATTFNVDGFIGVVFRDPSKMEGAPSTNLTLKKDTICEVMVKGHMYVSAKDGHLAGDLCLDYDTTTRTWKKGVITLGKFATDDDAKKTAENIRTELAAIKQLHKHIIFDETRVDADESIVSVQIIN